MITGLGSPPAYVTTSGHAPDESMGVAQGDLLSDLDQGIRDFLDYLWWYLAALDAPTHKIP